MKCVRLTGCKAIVSFNPWRVLKGPLDIVIDENGKIACIGSCSTRCEVSISCGGVVTPCFVDMLYHGLEGDPVELAEKPMHAAPEPREVHELGFCAALAYAVSGGNERVYTPASLVTPSLRVYDSRGGSLRVAVSTLHLSKTIVYRLRSERGKFPLEALADTGLKYPVAAVGSWVTSWEFEKIRDGGGFIIIPVVSQAVYGLGSPPRPDFIRETAFATFGLHVDSWTLVKSAFTTYNSVYWGRVGALDALRAATGKLIGCDTLEEGVRCDLQVVRYNRDEVTPASLILYSRGVVTLVVQGRVFSLE